MSNRFAVLEEESKGEEDDVENMWVNLKSAVKESAAKIFKKKRKQNKPWFNENCRKLVEQRREAKQKLLLHETYDTREQYNNINREVTRFLRSEKRKYIKNLLVKAEEDRTKNNSKDFYRSIRFFRKGYQPKTFGIKDEAGTVVGERTEVLNVWKKYFCKLLNGNEVEADGDSRTEAVALPDGVNVPEPTLEEVLQAIKSFKNGKAPGESTITMDMLKHGGKSLQEYLYGIILKIWKTEKIPNDWKEAVVIPLHKKGDKMECKNYRGISLLETSYKVLSKILLNRLKVFVEEIVGDHQAGFMKGRSTTDHIYVLKDVLSKYWELDKSLYILFIDFSKAYDCILRQELWSSLNKYQIPQKLIKLIKMCVEGSRCKVRVERDYTDSFEVKTGVRQGDGLSPILFNLVLEEALRKVKDTAGGAFVDGKINVLAYADDVALIAENRQDLKNLAENLLLEAGKVGLIVNESKTQYMKICRGVVNEATPLKVLDYSFNLTNEFKYLGVTIVSSNREENEIIYRIKTADRCYWGLNKLLSSKILSKKTKIRIYKTILQPILLYGCEVWSISKATEKKLITFENKVLRKIFGPLYEAGAWRIRKNRELREIYLEPDIVAAAKSKRLRWLGHVWRRDNTSILKQVFNGRPIGRRPLGRPRLRWRDQVVKDVRRLGVEMENCEDREEWRRIVGEAKNHLGFIWPQE